MDNSQIAKIVNTSHPYKQTPAYVSIQRTIYYGDVVSIEDETDGGRIKVRIPDLDNKTSDANLPWSYPLLPKYFHVYPQVGEKVRVFLEDINFPERSRYWLGSVISQPQKIGYDGKLTALSTTNLAITNPETAPSKLPDADGVYPLKTDVAIVGKVNTDIILRLNEVHIRAGKHENDNVLKLNAKNPAEINLNFEPKSDTANEYYSNTVIASDKIAIISHSGNPQFKAARVTPDDRARMFDEGHPVVRGDVLVEALNIIRNALITHIHGYSAVPTEKTEIITKLEKLEFEPMLQRNIVIN
jgi:hypothetical protein